MNKKLLFVLILALYAFTGYAKQRTETEALTIAKSFYGNNSHLKNAVGDLTLAYAGKDESVIRSVNGSVYYYIYNRGDAGFVVVSGDDRAKEVLGYSSEGAFDYVSAPDNLKYWLNCYKEEIKYLAGQPENITSDNKTTKGTKAFAANVQPLLGGIKWNQDDPYNLLCPTNTVTGCVATAMAQVMKYYEWPASGTGSHSYTTTTLGISLSADFSTAYDWANMTPTYNASSTQVQKDAVAKLMFHCGVSVDMNYNTSSGASLYKTALALKNYFNYDEGIGYKVRDFHSYDDWETLLKTELNAGRPVLYGGQSSGGGHAFVCDGYDNNDYFHFNWGWGGSSDGYFELSALNPSSLGIGGGSGGYNTQQDIITGIQPSTGDPATPQAASLGFLTLSTDVSTATTSQTVTVSATRIQNISLTTFIGYFGIALYDNDSNFKKDLYFYSTGGLQPGHYYPELTFSFNLNGLADGNYRIYPCTDEGGTEESDNYKYIQPKSGSPAYLNVTVSGTTVTFSKPTDGMPSLSGNSLQTVGTSSLYQNRLGQFTIDVTNTGAGDYSSNLAVLLYSAEEQQVVCNDPVVVAADETKTIGLSGTVTVAPGDYTLYVLYDPDNASNMFTPDRTNSLASIPVTVNPEPATAPALTLARSQHIFTSTFKNNIVMSASIKNTGGDFVNSMRVYLSEQGSTSIIANFGTRLVEIPSGTTKEVEFSGSVDLPPGMYRAWLFYNDNNSLKQLGNSTVFELLEDVGTGIESTVTETDPVTATQYYDLLGKEVKHLQRGSIYMVKEVHQSGKVSVRKIVGQ